MPDLWPQDSSSLPPAPAPVTAGHQQAQCVHHCHTVTTTGPMGMPPSRTALPAPGLRPVSSLPPPAAHAAADDGAAGTGAAESSSTSAAAGQHSRPVSTSRRPLARSISAPNAGRTLTKSGNASRRYRWVFAGTTLGLVLLQQNLPSLAAHVSAGCCSVHKSAAAVTCMLLVHAAARGLGATSACCRRVRLG